MKKLLIIVAAAALATPAMAVSYYVAGDFNAWDPAANLMADMGDGTYQLTLSGVSSGRHEFKVTDGSWDNAWPGSGNSWFLDDGAGNVTITFDANSRSDGWNGSWGRIGLNTDPGAWTAVGDWQGWDNVSSATAMTPIGGGLYQCQQSLAPGTYLYKAVVTGTWDAIGNDFRSINADNTSFTVTADQPLVTFQVDALSGIERVLVPEPSSFALLGIALAGLLCLRRRS